MSAISQMKALALQLNSSPAAKGILRRAIVLTTVEYLNEVSAEKVNGGEQEIYEADAINKFFTGMTINTTEKKWGVFHFYSSYYRWFVGFPHFKSILKEKLRLLNEEFTKE